MQRALKKYKIPAKTFKGEAICFTCTYEVTICKKGMPVFWLRKVRLNCEHVTEMQSAGSGVSATDLRRHVLHVAKRNGRKKNPSVVCLILCIFIVMKFLCGSYRSYNFPYSQSLTYSTIRLFSANPRYHACFIS